MSDSKTIHSESSNEKPATCARGTSNESVAWWHWHRRLYDWVIHFSRTKHGATALFILSFAESSFFPIPPDVLLGPLALGAPKKWLRFALACSVASVLGGILGYCIGLFLWSLIGQWVFAHRLVQRFENRVLLRLIGQQLASSIGSGEFVERAERLFGATERNHTRLVAPRCV